MSMKIKLLLNHFMALVPFWHWSLPENITKPLVDYRKRPVT